MQRFGPRRFGVTHLTRYSYSGPVQAAYNRAFLLPRDTPSQKVIESHLEISPEPDLVSHHVDYFGNHSSYVESRRLETELRVTCRSTVEVDWRMPDPDVLDGFTVGESAGLARREADPALFADFTLPSPLVGLDDAVLDYAAAILVPDRRLGDALVALYQAIYSDFEYRSGATSVRTTLGELLKLRQGVCQDFAHLAVGCLRAAGLPGRYVSGYLETEPPPGASKLQGADATHAWASVLTPVGWVDVDPTNRQWADSRYIVTAWGRDFTDVSPLRGVVYTEAASSRLDVAVDVVPLVLDD